MCGRYALGIRAAFVRHQFENYDMPVDEGQDEDDARESYNFAPGYHGLVYRADVPDSGARGHQAQTGTVEQGDGAIANDDDTQAGKQVQTTSETARDEQSRTEDDSIVRTKYKLQAMKWGLIPFWTKRNPEYGSMLKTINCRDDSLMENRGMWNTMKKGKRCIVVAQGFYEWLKKNGGKEKIPHYMKRKDEKLMCFAGLWDCVQYQGSDEKHYTYTVITTDSNSQLKFLHDRMPVILENGSDEMWTWLDPKRTEWTKELQSLLKPFKGELECYPVMKEVGKVGNNSADFLVPVASSDNKQNIANFFANAKSPTKAKESKDPKAEVEQVSELKQETAIKFEEDDQKTVNLERSEDNAPMPVTDNVSSDKTENQNMKGSKRLHEETQRQDSPTKSIDQPEGSVKKKLRSSTSNGSAMKGSPAKNGNQRITSFFGK